MKTLGQKRPHGAPPPEYKTCVECGETKPLTGFYNSKLRRCRPCQKERMRYQLERPARLELPPQCAYCTMCGEAKPVDEFSWGFRMGKTRRATWCKSCHGAYLKRYNTSHPEQRRWHHMNHKVRRRTRMVGAVTRPQWQAILSIYGHRCVYCGGKRRLGQDHIVPLAKGGTHSPDNVVPACLSCNVRKGIRPPKLLQLHLIR